MHVCYLISVFLFCSYYSLFIHISNNNNLIIFNNHSYFTLLINLVYVSLGVYLDLKNVNIIQVVSLVYIICFKNDLCNIV